jgi:hypothetical protein
MYDDFWPFVRQRSALYANGFVMTDVSSGKARDRSGLRHVAARTKSVNSFVVKRRFYRESRRFNVIINK